MQIIWFVLALLSPFALIWRFQDRLRARLFPSTAQGLSQAWQLTDGTTDVVSNLRLGAIQQLTGKHALLKRADKIVVWANRFLDDDVLFDVVSENIEKGVGYFYVLNVSHVEAFGTFLENLYKKIDKTKVDKLVDVIFVREELTLHNFVILSHNSKNRRVCYSSLIYSQLPFAWVRGDRNRTNVLLDGVNYLVASVAVAQFKNQVKCMDDSDFGEVKDPHQEIFYPRQLMDFSKLGKRLWESGGENFFSIPFELDRVTSEVRLPPNALARLAAGA